MSTTTTNVSTETAYSLVADSYGYRANFDKEQRNVM